VKGKAQDCLPPMMPVPVPPEILPRPQRSVHTLVEWLRTLLLPS
jgi:hypothetical protein